MKAFLGFLVYIIASVGIFLLFDVIFYVTHRILFGETVGECMKNNPVKIRLQKSLVDVIIASVIFTALFAAVLGILFTFDI